MSKEKKDLIGVLLSSSIGGVLEMYDFVLFILLAPILATHFLPKQNKMIALLYTLMIFAAGYFVRPLGGLVFGHYGDRFGRKRGLVLAIIMMGGATVAIGLLPTYAMAGATATILLLVCRLVQGFAIGGDLPGALIFTAEHSPIKYVAFNCSLVFLGVNLGTLLGAGIVTILHYFLTATAMQDWGWRLPFLASAIIFIIGTYLRNKIPESELFLLHKNNNRLCKMPLFDLWQRHSSLISRGCGLVALFAIAISLLFLYMPSFLVAAAHMPEKIAAKHNLISLVIFCSCLPIMGLIVDKSKIFNYQSSLLMCGVFFLIFSYPAYELLLGVHNFFGVQLTLFLLDVFAALLVVATIRALVSLFPATVRYSGIGLCYNLCFAVFGGLSPVVATVLIHHNYAKVVGALLSVAAFMLLLSQVGYKKIDSL
jgi:MFS family permease